MSSERWKLDDEIARSLEGLKIKAPSGSWQNIEKTLDIGKSRRMLYYLPWAAVVALAFIAGILLYPDSEPVLTDLKTETKASKEIEIDTITKLESPIVSEEGTTQTENADFVQERFKNSGQPQTAFATKANLPVDEVRVGRIAADNSVRIGRTAMPLAVQKRVVRIAYIIQVDEIGAILAEIRPGRLPVFNEVEEQESSRPLYAIGGSAAPQYSFRNSISGSDNAMFNQTGGKENLQKEHGYLAFAGGVDFGVTNDRWSFNSGVHFSRQGQQMDEVVVSKLVFPSNQSTNIAATSLGNILLNQNRSPISLEDINSINEIDYQFNSVTIEEVDATVTSVFDFVEIPFTATYRLLEAPLEVRLLGGAGLAFLINDKTEFVYQGNTTEIGGLPNLRTTNYQAMMGVQFVYPIRAGLSLYLQPLYKQSLNSLTRDLLFDYQPYQISFSTGVVLSF